MEGIGTTIAEHQDMKATLYTPELIEEAIQLYKTGLGYHRIAKRLGVAASALRYHLAKAGVVSRTELFGKKSHRYSHDVALEMATLYLQGMPCNDITAKYDITLRTLHHYLDNVNAGRRDNTELSRKYSVNQHFFADINDPDKAYWLGFLAADGGIRNKSYQIRLNLCAKDRSHLEAFLGALGSDTPIRSIVMGKYHSDYAIVCSKALVQQLARYGVIEKKSLVFTWPALHYELYPDFVRGYFDGDGCAFTSRNGRELGIGFYGTQSFLHSLRQYLQEALSHTKVPSVCFLPKSNIFGLRYAGSYKPLAIYRLMYYNRDSIHLQRKRAIVEDFIKGRPELGSH